MSNVLLRKLGIDAPLGGWLLGGPWTPVDDSEPEPPPTFDPAFGAGLVTSNRRTGGLVTTNQRSAGGSGDD